MPLIDYLKLYGTNAAEVLDQGEQLLDMGLYREPLIGDESKLGRTIDELSPRLRERVERRGGQTVTGSDRFVQGFDVLAGGLRVNPHRIDRIFGRISGVGGRDSVAGRMWRAGRNRVGGTYYAVTGHRLLLLGTDKVGLRVYRVLFDVPRAEVASAVRKGKILFQRGRVEIRFTDGSMLALTPGMVSTARARSLVAALSSPMSPGEAS